MLEHIQKQASTAYSKISEASKSEDGKPKSLFGTMDASALMAIGILFQEVARENASKKGQNNCCLIW